MPLALLVLLVAELLALTVAFDTQSLERSPSIWARLLGWTPQYLRAAITVVLASLLFGGRDLWKAWQQLTSGDASRVNASALIVHGGALAAFWATTARIVNGHFEFAGALSSRFVRRRGAGARDDERSARALCDNDRPLVCMGIAGHTRSFRRRRDA